mmetsp:Transcript_4221/g.6381  ORF Transcript_4221/g.6381 Transcript_4221/m.6381 type:complete len:346 (-) Transcript_4221:96-1133(-)
MFWRKKQNTEEILYASVVEHAREDHFCFFLRQSVSRMLSVAGSSSKTPSSAFCLLARLFTLRCTEKQMSLMLDHVDSPYIRCIGFLYLRFAVEPTMLWSWMAPYLLDPEPLDNSTVGSFVVSLLQDSQYFNVRLARLPLPVERDLKVKCLQAQEIEKRAKDHWDNRDVMQYVSKVGAQIRALYGDEEHPIEWYNAVVEKVFPGSDPGSKPTFEVTFSEYGNTETVTLGEIDLPKKDDKAYSRRARDRGGDEFKGRKKDDLYEHVLQQERDKMTAGKGQAYYTSRPASCKSTLAVKQEGGYKERYDDSRNYSRKRSHPEQRRQQEDSSRRGGRQYEKKQKLLSRYG